MMKKRNAGICGGGQCGIFLASWCTAATAADPFTLTSTMFKDGTMVPQKSYQQRAELLGREHLAAIVLVKSAERERRALAIMLVDPEGGGGAGAIHWVAYGIAPERNRL